MTLIVLTVLAAAWLGYFVLWFRERRPAQPMRTDGMVSFDRSLPDTRSRSARPAGVGGKPRRELFEAPRSPQQAHSRRRQVAVALVSVAVASLLAVPVLGAAALAVHVLADMVLLLFAFGAVHRHQPAEPSMSGVRMLYPQRLAPSDAVAAPLRRAVNS